ncbi:MAG: hypothetical protein ABW024_02200 [Microbacterium sp.]
MSSGESKQEWQWPSTTSWVLGIAVGVAIGIAIGAAMGNIGVGIALGVSIGVGFALAFGEMHKRRPAGGNAGEDQPPT